MWVSKKKSSNTEPFPGCTGKVKFTTKKKAEEASKKYSEKNFELYGLNLAAYYCVNCCNYHIGSYVGVRKHSNAKLFKPSELSEEEKQEENIKHLGSLEKKMSQSPEGVTSGMISEYNRLKQLVDVASKGF